MINFFALPTVFTEVEAEYATVSSTSPFEDNPSCERNEDRIHNHIVNINGGSQ
jgi:hypothetical protein